MQYADRPKISAADMTGIWVSREGLNRHLPWGAVPSLDVSHLDHQPRLVAILQGWRRVSVCKLVLCSLGHHESSGSFRFFAISNSQCTLQSQKGVRMGTDAALGHLALVPFIRPCELETKSAAAGMEHASAETKDQKDGCICGYVVVGQPPSIFERLSSIHQSLATAHTHLSAVHGTCKGREGMQHMENPKLRDPGEGEDQGHGGEHCNLLIHGNAFLFLNCSLELMNCH